VLCCDEKTQIQALDRTQPGLPLKRGRGKTTIHDYKRNGVTTLFAAMDMLTGQVLSMTDQLHRLAEREAATDAVWAAPGVTGVVDRMTLAR